MKGLLCISVFFRYADTFTVAPEYLMCSTIIFNIGSRKCLAENYDYVLDHGLVGTNLRGTKKTNGRGVADGSIEWSVKYGSITFNQFSLEMPVSGMNEAGLVVALMWHEEGDYGVDDQYLRMSSLQWIQYQLDNFERIDEVVVGLQSIHPEQGPIPLHFMLLDSYGDCLIVEFIDGELVLRKNVNYPILTNTSYDKCITASEHSESHDLETLGNSMGRFVHLYRQLSIRQDEDNSAAIGFKFLDSVSQTKNSNDVKSFPWAELENETMTAWSIVFDPVRKSIMFKTDKNRTIRKLSLDEWNFDVTTTYQVADINAGVAGDMTPFFESYSIDRNHAIIKLAAPVVGLPDEAIEGLAEAVDYLYRERRMS